MVRGGHDRPENQLSGQAFDEIDTIPSIYGGGYIGQWSGSDQAGEARTHQEKGGPGEAWPKGPGGKVGADRGGERLEAAIWRDLMGQGDVLRWFKKSMGWYSADEVAGHLNVTKRNAQKALAKLAKDGDLEVDRSGKNRKFRYRYINRDQSYSSLGLAAQESQTEATGKISTLRAKLQGRDGMG